MHRVRVRVRVRVRLGQWVKVECIYSHRGVQICFFLCIETIGLGLLRNYINRAINTYYPLQVRLWAKVNAMRLMSRVRVWVRY